MDGEVSSIVYFELLEIEKEGEKLSALLDEAHNEIFSLKLEKQYLSEHNKSLEEENSHLREIIQKKQKMTELELGWKEKYEQERDNCIELRKCKSELDKKISEQEMRLNVRTKIANNKT